MSRQLRIEYPGAFYHIIQRGLERREIFREEKDYEKFLKHLSWAHASYGVNFHTYCLMPNHYHLIIETPDANLKKAMHMINTGYSVYFNLKYRRSGPLFQGRYKSPLIEADEYLHHVSRYIHLNPVKTVAKLTEKPEDYKWSSYRMFTGKEKAPEWLKTDFILGMFGKSQKEAGNEYDKFVKDAMVNSKEIIEKNNITGVFVGGKNTGYRLKEISALAGGITYSGISQICRRIDKRRIDDKRIDGVITKVNREVSKVKTRP